MPLGLLIPLLTPVVTELVKWFVKVIIPNAVVTEVPPVLVPLISAAMGAACTALAPMAGLDPGVSLAEGAALGLAGTGVHQTQRLAMHAVSNGTIKALAWLILIPAVLVGCTQLQTVLTSEKTKQACQAVTILQKAVIAVRGDIVALGPDAAKVYNDIATGVNTAGMGCALIPPAVVKPA